MPFPPRRADEVTSSPSHYRLVPRAPDVTGLSTCDQDDDTRASPFRALPVQAVLVGIGPAAERAHGNRRRQSRYPRNLANPTLGASPISSNPSTGRISQPYMARGSAGMPLAMWHCHTRDPCGTSPKRAGSLNDITSRGPGYAFESQSRAEAARLCSPSGSRNHAAISSPTASNSAAMSGASG